MICGRCPHSRERFVRWLTLLWRDCSKTRTYWLWWLSAICQLTACTRFFLAKIIRGLAGKARKSLITHHPLSRKLRNMNKEKDRENPHEASAMTPPPTIDRHLTDHVRKRPACVSCSNAKRRCTKQLPACARCRGKKQRCVYPMTHVVLASGSAISPVLTPEEEEEESSNATALPSLPPVPSIGEHWPALGTSEVPPNPHAAVHFMVVDERLTNPWFLSPSFWNIDPSPANGASISYPGSGLDHFITKLRHQLDMWIDESHCFFIHPRLYNAGDAVPGPLVDAYSAYATYRCAPGANQKIGLEVVNRNAKRLLQEQSLYDGLDNGVLDTLGHLARTQALFVYQFIRLFDGDIRLRGDAEATSATLFRWSCKLMQSAASDIASGTGPLQGPVQYPARICLRTDNTLVATWRAWILSESIRRTWIIATLTEAAFSILKQGFADCPGSISFTSRAELWDAASPREWLNFLERMEGSHGFPMTCEGVPALLSNATPSMVDEFTNSLIAYGAGREDWEDWMVSCA